MGIVCVHVFVYVCRVCGMCVRLQMCVFVQVRVRAHMCAFTCARVCMSLDVCVCAGASVCTRVCFYVCTCAYCLPFQSQLGLALSARLEALPA